MTDTTKDQVVDAIECNPVQLSPIDPSQPLPHDGLSSRRFIAGVAAFLVIFFGASGLLAWSGNEMLTNSGRWFSEESWQYALLIASTILLVCLGLLSFDKLLELIKAVKSVPGLRK